ncbi:hypothetical protein [Dapis sp. BLCC M229]|uniref:hypothetical protein n=1 Tax=Dapis sp. BLCC M229 TaxID=3400188 RepID=UPI003CE9E8AD
MTLNQETLFSENKLFDEELLNNETIILSYDASIYINTEEYKISKPREILNPLWVRVIDGRGRKNKFIYIHGKIYLTNYRIIFKAKKEKVGIFGLDGLNAYKNRLYGKIDIFLWDIITITRFKHLIRRGLNIYDTTKERYKFWLRHPSINLLSFIKEFDAAKKDINEANFRRYSYGNSSSKLIIHSRLEQHNKFWLEIVCKGNIKRR